MLNLLKPGKIGKLRIKNRIVMGPMGITGLVDPDGRYSQRGIDFYARRAAGGTGLIISGVVLVDSEIERRLVVRPKADAPDFITKLEELANAVHAYEARLCLQLSAGSGRLASPAAQKAGYAVATSPVPCVWPPHIKPRELTLKEIDKLVRAFGTAARMAKSAGVDAIDLHGHGGYLIDGFMTALWNKRSDKYGGDLEGRLRFLLEIIESIRGEVGPDFPIMFKFAGSHRLAGGRETEESCEVARRLQQAGIAAIAIDAGCYDTQHWVHPPIYMPPGCYLDLIEAVKRVIDIPVIAVGKLGYPELAEEVLATGKADFIELSRPLLADPDWSAKVREGRPGDVRICIGCHEGCLGRSVENKYLSCAINPATGMERDLALAPAQQKKRVLVIGGGPAGMEAARIAALRGHRVTLWEKNDRLGGNLIPASAPDFKSDLATFINYLSDQVAKLGVDTKLMTDATPELVREMKPDEIFIATGSTPLIPEVPGGSRGKVVTAVDVLTGKRDVGDEVVIAGGGLVGCETAVWLAQKGKKITIVETLPDVLQDMSIPSPNRVMLRKMLVEAGVTILPGTDISGITDGGVTISRNGKSQTIKADTVVFAAGMKSRRGLLDALEGEVPVIHAVGDCVAPRKIMNAVWDAYYIARLI